MHAKINQIADIHGSVREIEITLSFVRISNKERGQIMRLFNSQNVLDVKLHPISYEHDDTTVAFDDSIIGSLP